MKRICKLPDCDKPITKSQPGQKWCAMHWSRYRKYKDPYYPVEKREQHGMYKTPEYKLWSSIISRTRYNRGGIDIYWKDVKMCEEWQKSFLAFYKHVGKKEPGMTLDRIDSTKGYEPGNVRWVDRHVQSVNRKIQSNNTTGYRGVYYRKDSKKKWRSRVVVRGQAFSIGGLQETPEEAAWMYDQLAMQLYGQYARPNFEYV